MFTAVQLVTAGVLIGVVIGWVLRTLNIDEDNPRRPA